MGLSGEKGSEFERQMCSRLSMWVTGGLRDDVFWRSASSGGRARFATRKSNAQRYASQVGDISAVDPLGAHLLSIFTVECKFWKDLQLQHSIFGFVGDAMRMWLDFREVCRVAGRLPLFIAKQNKKQELVCTTMLGLELLDRGCVPGVELPIRAVFPSYGMVITPLRDVLVDVDYAKLRTLL